jgi:hypothetical protein
VPLVTVSNPAVVVEAVKLAEDGSGDLVIRLYESLGGRARATVTADAEVGSVNATDLLERHLAEGAASEGPSIDLELRPFQLVTLRSAVEGEQLPLGHVVAGRLGVDWTSPDAERWRCSELGTGRARGQVAADS